MTWSIWLLSGLLIVPLVNLSFREFSDYAWVVILIAIFTYLLLLGLMTRRVLFKILFFNISAIFFALFLFEGFLLIKERSQTSGKSVQKSGDYIAGAYFSPHPYLGYAPANDGVFTSKKTINNELIYDISYTIKDGLRFTPNSNDNSQNCVLFFGCSFTFGEGLSDTSTLPFFFNRYAKQDYKVLNYSFHGYGPHQMLANIENRVAKDLQGLRGKKNAIYSFMTFHIERAAGFASWDQKGPKYEIIDGNLSNAGTFSKLSEKTLNKFLRSYIYKRLFFERKPSHYDFIRAIEIIKKSNELLLKDSVTLYVLVWDNVLSNAKSLQNDYSYFIDEMKKNNIKTLFLHDAIGDFVEKRLMYSIHTDDLHPNALANEKIAKYLYLQINDDQQTIN